MVEIMKPAEISFLGKLSRDVKHIGGQIIDYFFDMIMFSREHIARVCIQCRMRELQLRWVMNHLGWGGFRDLSQSAATWILLALLRCFLLSWRISGKGCLARNTHPLYTCHSAQGPRMSFSPSDCWGWSPLTGFQKLVWGFSDELKVKLQGEGISLLNLLCKYSLNYIPKSEW